MLLIERKNGDNQILTYFSDSFTLNNITNSDKIINMPHIFRFFRDEGYKPETNSNNLHFNYRIDRNSKKKVLLMFLHRTAVSEDHMAARGAAVWVKTERQSICKCARLQRRGALCAPHQLPSPALFYIWFTKGWSSRCSNIRVPRTPTSFMGIFLTC